MNILPLTTNPAYTSTTDEFINIDGSASKEATAYRGMSGPEPSSIRSSITYLPPPFPPPAISYEEETRLPFMQRYRRLLRVIVYLFVLLAVTAGLTVPVVLYYQDEIGIRTMMKRSTEISFITFSAGYWSLGVVLPFPTSSSTFFLTCFASLRGG